VLFNFRIKQIGLVIFISKYSITEKDSDKKGFFFKNFKRTYNSAFWLRALLKGICFKDYNNAFYTVAIKD
jgi:hypothetical protein